MKGAVANVRRAKHGVESRPVANPRRVRWEAVAVRAAKPAEKEVRR